MLVGRPLLGRPMSATRSEVSRLHIVCISYLAATVTADGLVVQMGIGTTHEQWIRLRAMGGRFDWTGMDLSALDRMEESIQP